MALILLNDRCRVMLSIYGGSHSLEFCQFAEVLGSNCEGEFVLGTAWAT